MIALWTLIALARHPEPDQVSLITFGPGPEVWESAGHTGLRVRDRYGDRIYHWGVFDFSSPGFAARFIAGNLIYSTIALDTSAYLWRYEQVEREVSEQDLALTPAQHADLLRRLEWAISPSQRDYLYQLLTRNCATQARDALDATLGGALRADLDARPGHPARFDTQRLSRPQPLLWVGADLLLGAAADRPLSVWDQAMTPVTLSEALVNVLVDGKPLVTGARVLVKGKYAPPLSAPPFFWPPWVAAGVLAVGTALFPARLRRAWLSPWLVALSTLGAVLFGVWFTAHTAFQDNGNALLFSPVLALSAVLWRNERWYQRGIALSAILAGAGVALSVSLGQSNGGWIALSAALHASLWAAGRGRG